MNKLRSNQIFAVLLGSAAFPLLCRTEPFTIEGIFGAANGCSAVLLRCSAILLRKSLRENTFRWQISVPAGCPLWEIR